MDVAALSIMIPIIGIIGIVVTVIYLRRYSNEERMAMIDKGLDPSLFANKQGTISGTLRASLLLIGAGVGLLLGYILEYNFRMDEVGYFSMVLISGGIGLGIAYYLEERRLKKEL